MTYTYPVIETFGPTIQGEGALAGSPTLFVRFGGCDFRCTWCDSMYAVDPTLVRENAVKLTAEEIVAELGALIGLDTARGGPEGRGMWVTLSGGNPALMKFAHGVDLMQRLGMRVAVETQGSIWRAWLSDVDHLTVSPKPPSSGMATPAHLIQTAHFLTHAQDMPYERRSLKVVVFDEEDYDYASGMFQSYPDWQHFLSVGTDQDYLQDEYRVHNGIAERYRWLCNKVAVDPVMRNAKAFPQLHVIAFGTGRGV